MDFHGVKVALLYGDKLVMQLRDNKPGLYNANMWDFPGGGRENNETPRQCATREVMEEFGIHLEPGAFVWEKTYPALKDPNQKALFMVAMVTKNDIDTIQFAEGQRWELFDYDTFFQKGDVVDAMKGRFKDYLDAHA